LTRRQRLSLGALAAVLCLVGLLALSPFGVPGLAAQPTRTSTPPPAVGTSLRQTVGVAAAEWATWTLSVLGDGTVQPWQEIIISAKVGGQRALEVHVEEGDYVRAGQPLVTLDRALLVTQRDQALASVEDAASELRLLESDRDRAVNLYRNQASSRQLLEQRISAVERGIARLQLARARLSELEVRLAQSVIHAPVDGLISRRSVLPGAVPLPGVETFRIIRDGRLELAARVPERHLHAVRPGQAARVFAGGQVHGGIVRIVAPTVAADSRLGLVYITLGAPAQLQSGMFAQAEITTGEARTVTVPQEAIVFKGGQPQVFVVDPTSGRAHARYITPGQRRNGRVAVAQGVEAADLIVISGGAFLADGEIVDFVRQPASPQRL
jgi:RND family efflux transporter MFP subunit